MNRLLKFSSESLELNKKSSVLFLFFGLLVTTVFSQANFCGTKDPDPDKTCISVRLSWQEEPIYFCTDKGNIKYRNQCGSQQMNCGNQWNKDTLLVATPWDCCPLASIPDQCQNAHCPPSPFNRTCESIPPNSEQPWDCCPRFACQGGGQGGFKAEDCHLKQLEPGCMSPPKDKTNCIGFIDPHLGCCTQFQCDGDGKPGMCPMHMAAMKYSASGPHHHHNMSMPMAMAKSEPMMMSMPVSEPMPMPAEDVATNSGKTVMKSRRAATMKPKGNHDYKNANMVVSGGGGASGSGESGMDMSEIHRASGSYNSYATSSGSYGSYGPHHQSPSVSIAVEPYPAHGAFPAPMQYHLGCTGDWNCPGAMLCCSSDLTVYSDGSAIARNTHPTYGYCVEPVM